ncbi:MAG: DUF748 domain-containing protein [Betaproteobacteria bacterium]|nr:DUF748 domain-containing protein [Betaproteobacteria bacterium]
MSPTLRRRAADFARKPGLRLFAAVLSAVVLLSGLFVHFFLPDLIKSRTERFVVEELHRRLSIAAVEINPFTLVVRAQGVKLLEAQSEAVFAAFDSLEARVSAESLFRLAPVVAELKLTRPYVHLVRTDAHRYNVDDLVELIAKQPPADEPVRFSVYNIEVEGGRIEFDDRPRKTTHTVADIRLGVPFVSSLPASVAVFVEPLLSMKVNGTPVQVKGKVLPFTESREAVANLSLEGLDLTDYLEYLPFEPRFKVPGARLDLRLTASFRQPKETAPALMLGGSFTFRDVQVTDLGGKPVLKLPLLTASLGNTDVFAGRFEIARAVVVGVQADVSRGRDGELNVMRLLPPAGGRAAVAATRPPAVSLAVGELDIHGAALRYADAYGARPLSVGVEKLDLAVRQVAVDPAGRTVSVGEIASGSAGIVLRQGKPGAATAVETKAASAGGREKPAAGRADGDYAMSVGRLAVDHWSVRLEDRSLPRPAVTVVAPLSLSFQDLSTARSAPGRVELKATVNNTGRLALSGGIGLAPLQADLALDLKGVDILPLQPYITDRVNLLVTRASLTSKGRLRLAQGNDGTWQGGFKGALAVSDLAAVDKLGANDFLRWKSLSLAGLDLRLAPFALAADQVAVKNFFARVIVDGAGRINLQDIVRSDADAHDAPAGAAAPTPENGKVPGEVPPIKVGKLTLQGGSVRFTDNFIKPNYTANLMELGGTVTDLSSDASSAAGVDLRGQVNGAPLGIAGRINPLKGDLFLDLKADVRGMELAPMSPYSGKYVGYGIDKGKLSFEVAYKMENRELAAQNRLILDQLTFGEKVDSPDAADLPVHLAVALLRDRHGVIDIDLPIGGSLDDPQFSVGSLVVKVIVNLISKAVTAPFALLGSMFGGGEELAWLEFDPGSAAIAPAGEGKLQSLAKALVDRPALKLEISGGVDFGADREGLKRATIERKARALRLKDLVAKGQSADVDGVTVSRDEYPALLARAYKAEKFPKPRNLIGLQKDLPVGEMEKLMIANAEVGDDDLKALGNQRALATKEWLLKNGQVPAERVFIVGTKSTGVPDGESGTKANRVMFSLR